MIKKRVGVLISGRGSNMESLLEAAKERSYPAEIVIVVSNNPEAPGLARAEAHAIPTAVIDHRPHGKDRAAFERALEAVLEEHRVELRSEEHTSELQSLRHLVCRLLLEKKKK